MYIAGSGNAPESEQIRQTRGELWEGRISKRHLLWKCGEGRSSSSGYRLVEQLAEKGIPVESNTLYPLLRRLSSQGLLEDRWDTSSSKPRKYYCITDEGKRVRDALAKQWNHMSDAMKDIMKDVG